MFKNRLIVRVVAYSKDAIERKYRKETWEMKINREYLLSKAHNTFNASKCCLNGFVSPSQLLSHLNNTYKHFDNIAYHLQHPHNAFPTMLTVCNKLHPFMAFAYHLQQSHLIYRLQPSSIPPFPTTIYWLLSACGN